MTSKELYTKGSRVWVPNPELVWEIAEVVQDYVSGILKVKTKDGTVKELTIVQEENLPPLRNPDILIGENDLTSLSYLHEPAVLYNLQVRFCRREIYTYCGIVLVAINPYQDLPIYNADTIHAYRGQAMGDLEPHIFAVAEEAYTKMEREQRDQSIIVSGELGAGKTVSAKYAMRYFATVGGSITETHVERKVLASSPIMEAFGNAKTTHNDNSSRFGKFIELQFSQTYNIIGASMRTYLLEKSRVVFQAPEERNYHILYQLCAGRHDYPYLHLDEARTFQYLNQETLIPGVDDGQCFQETVSALVTLGFSEPKITDIFRVLAAILHLGNIRITGNSDMDDSSISECDPHLQVLSDVVGLDVRELRKWLCQRKLVSHRDVVEKPLTVTEALGARNALAKYIYAELFSWIVGTINEALETSSELRHKFIGVLDIYGFETLETSNSFEQLCINYANEKLQQQFNQHVFKLEQDEYENEGIEWKFIDFYDNQPCIDLIETKLGILDLLDEECKMPKGSDSSWAEKLYVSCTKWPEFSTPRFGANAFCIKHFADKVEYTVDGFLEKNRDTVIEEQVEVMRNAENQLLKHLFRKESKLAVPGGPVPRTRSSASAATLSKNKKSVGSQFRGSLTALMATLNATTPHYIRCIKPNDDKAPFEYNPQRAVQQLRDCGVLETIRISAAGFPSRWQYLDFFNRYRVLCESRDIKRDNMKATCKWIVVNFIKDNNRFKFGNTKMFFRAGQVAYLERLRSERLRRCCVIMQTAVRGFVQRKRYLRIRHTAQTLQRYARGLLARRRVECMRRERAALTIQRYTRGWLVRRKYVRLRRLVVGLQARARGMLMRRSILQTKYNIATLVIQKHVRGWLCRSRYAEQVRSVVVAQSAVRRFLAHRQLRRLKKEARSVQHHIKLNRGLEIKIIKLQQQNGELTKENNGLKNINSDLIETRAKLDVLRGADVELKKRTVELNEQEKRVLQLSEELERERGEKVHLVTEREALRVEYETENENLHQQLQKMDEQLQQNKVSAEELLKSRLHLEKHEMLEKHDHELKHYQRVLFEKSELEGRCKQLEREVARLRGHTRAPSDSSAITRPDEDLGYGSVRSASSRQTDASDWSLQTTPENTMNRSKNQTTTQSQPSGDQTVDVGLVLKLQHRLQAVEGERERLHRNLEDKDRGGPHKRKLQELEIENSKLKADLSSLWKAICDAMQGKRDELLNLFKAHNEELVRMRDDWVQYRSGLDSEMGEIMSLANSSSASRIIKDGELILAYDAQKKINRILVDELEKCQTQWSVVREELKAKLARLQKETEEQLAMLSANIKSPQSQNEAFLQHEIVKISDENLKLQEKCDKFAEVNRKLKREMKEMKERISDAGVSELVSERLGTTEQSQSSQPLVRKKERKYMFGMFEYRKEDEKTILKKLILDLKPQEAVKMLPCMAAYIVFMCVRHTDFINDELKVQSLLEGYVTMTRKRLKKKKVEDLETTAMWLSNTMRLLHCLKQYSGEKEFQKKNTTTQNEQCLRNFDLSEYRSVISDFSIWIYTTLVNQMEERLQGLTVQAILEREAISGLSAGKRGRSSSVSGPKAVQVQMALDSLLYELSTFHRTLILHGVDQELIIQIFRQVFYYICASSLNTLLLRRDLCNWSKGLNIQYNLMHVEQWARNEKLNVETVLKELAPILQAAKLLQARKLDENVARVCDECSSMTVLQIVKLLNLYTPTADFEEQVTLSFISKVKQRLLEKRPDQNYQMAQRGLLNDTKFHFMVHFQFNPSQIKLEEIEVPEELNLPILKKL